MTTQPMPLDETMRLLSEILNDVEYKHRYSVQKRDGAKSTLEQALYSNVADGQAEEMSILTSALHHLEAGKRGSDRQTSLVEALSWALDLLDMYDRRLVELGQPPELVFSDVHMDGKIRAKKALFAVTESTTEPQG